MSYLYRSVNAVIAPDLIEALQLDANALGLLTSVYFLTFACFQLPLGLLLDRYGPRRVESVLLLIAASGAFIFAYSEQLSGLIVGRALIGLGVSACLMASLKATASWFPNERLPAMNGFIMAAGGIGALTATAPVEAALSITDWRGVISGLALATIIAAIIIFTTVPEPPKRAASTLKELLLGLWRIYCDRYFWRLVPLMIATQAAFLSIQGLWAGPWFKDVAGLDRITVTQHLFWLAVAMVAGFLLLGNLASRLQRYGVPLMVSTCIALIIFIAVQLLLTLQLTAIALPLWLLFGFFGSAGILFFPLLSKHFPIELAGRVNTAANVLIFLVAFASQWAIGAIIDLWPVAEGYHPRGYQAAFGIFFAVQVAGLLWFLPALRHQDHEQRG